MNTPKFYFELVKKDPKAHMVYGYASTEALDSQGEVVKIDAMKAAIDDYMKFANIREMHQPKAVGKAKKAVIDGKGLYLSAKIVDKDAWEKVEEGVYSGFSIGGRVNTMVDNAITGLSLSEISLVDRPANPEATFDVWKRNDDGNVETLATVATPPTNTTQPDQDEANESDDDEDEEDTEDANEENEDDEGAGTVPESDKKAASTEVDDLLKVIDQKVKSGAMPSEQEIDLMLKIQELPVSDKTRGMMKFEMAGLIVKAVEAKMQEQLNADAVKKEAEKLLNEADVQVANTVGEKHSFKKILSLIEQAETFIKQNDEGNLYELSAHQDTVAVETANANRAAANNTGKPKGDWGRSGNEGATDNNTTLPQQPTPGYENNMATDGNPNQTAALSMLQAVVTMLNNKGLAGALTPSEITDLQNGVRAGSEVTAANQMSVPPAGNAYTAAETTRTLSKLEGKLMEKIADLEAQVTKLNATPMPITIKTSYQTIEKVEKTDEAENKDALVKAEARADELHALMNQAPHNLVLQKEAATLSAHIQKLRREVRG